MEYPERVTLCEDGVYRWRYTLSREQAKTHYVDMIAIAVLITTVISLIMLVAIGWQVWWGVLLLYAFIVGLPALIGWLMLGFDTRSYEMDEEYIRHKHATKGGDAFAPIKKMKGMRVQGNVFRIMGTITEYTVYVPPEDVEFVKAYIREHAGK